MKKTNIKSGFELLPQPIVDHISGEIKFWPARPHVYHVTSLISCLKKTWYKRTYPGRVQKWTIRGLWNVYRGSTFDRAWTPLFKIHQRNYKATQRGVTISGTFDFIHDDGDGPVIYDLKMPVNIEMKELYGAGGSYRKQVQSYISLAHANGEFLDIHKARVLMVGSGGVVVEEVPEWVDMLDEFLFPRAFALDEALNVGSPVGLSIGESWECGFDSDGVSYCPVDAYFRKTCRAVK